MLTNHRYLIYSYVLSWKQHYGIISYFRWHLQTIVTFCAMISSNKELVTFTRRLNSECIIDVESTAQRA